MFGKKKHEKKQRALSWYYVESQQMLSRLSDTEILPGHYAVITVNTHPFGTPVPDRIKIVANYVEALRVIRDNNDWAKEHDISVLDEQITILDCHKQIICWVNAGQDAQPVVPDLDAIFGTKPDNANMLDKALNKMKAQQIPLE